MLEFPKLITINQTESIEGFSEGRNSTDCQLRVDCETESTMTYLHRKSHRERHTSETVSLKLCGEYLWCKADFQAMQIFAVLIII